MGKRTLFNMTFFHLHTKSGNIRGHQIGHYLGAQINPSEGYNDDICIHVKKTPIHGRVKVYDCMDNMRHFKYLEKHPDVIILAISKTSVEFLSDMFKNRIIYVPQHHCNFNREQRVDREIKTAGWCGFIGSFSHLESEIREKLNKIGIELLVDYKWNSRKSVINFYKKIDIQIAFREQADYNKMLKNPLKLSNAGSFGIPTIAKPEPNFISEYDQCFFPAKTIDEMVDIAF
ncbi:MAG TPA: hypothetical protein VMW91_11240, partial [Desulfosporosinus sp.]|nr:hypothetical protein [Desulfosporosinus sp.]